ncbi:hypothetical protein B0189_10475 [Moraxella cuniculi]|nr:hypothetical protein B0189_10475 [Moraxella cuniculi]
MNQGLLNFDVPQHMALQYLDRMGLFMFMKFFIRFQGVLTRAIGKKPASILLLQLMSMQLGMIGILDPFILFRLGNPFSGSVFNLFDAFKGIAGIALIGRILF